MTIETVRDKIIKANPDGELSNLYGCTTSEMVCRALQLGGVVSGELNASEQTPADVIEFDCLDGCVQIG